MGRYSPGRVKLTNKKAEKAASIWWDAGMIAGIPTSFYEKIEVVRKVTFLMLYFKQISQNITIKFCKITFCRIFYF